MNARATSSDPFAAVVLSVASAGRRDGAFAARQLLRSARLAGRTRSLQLWPARYRDSWTVQYLRTCYTDTFDACLAASICGGAISLNTALTERLASEIADRTGIRGRAALQAVAVVQSVATTDAATAAAGVHRIASACGVGRTLELIGTSSNNPVRSQLMRQWFLRNFLDTIDEALLGDQRPRERAVSRGEAREVARMLATGQLRKLIGPDHIPIVTAHGTQRDDLDRRLLRGEVGVIAPYADESPPPTPRDLLLQARTAWTLATHVDREHWLHSKRFPADFKSRTWRRLPPPVQSRWITDRVLAGRAARILEPFTGTLVTATDTAVAAGQVFAQHPLPSHPGEQDTNVTAQVFHSERALSPSQLGLTTSDAVAVRIHQPFRDAAPGSYNRRRYSNSKHVNREIDTVTDHATAHPSRGSQPSLQPP